MTRLDLTGLWRQLRYGWCRHRHLVRVHQDAVWYFECPCGYRVPMVARTAQERARARRHVEGA